MPLLRDTRSSLAHPSVPPNPVLLRRNAPRRYGVTHSGLDAMVVRYMEEMATFANLPNNLAYVNHSS